MTKNFYTANYCRVNPNFTIQNLPIENNKSKGFGLFCVLQNILQRGYPCLPSRFLKSQIDSINQVPTLLKPACSLQWHSTIKGSEEGVNPALVFYRDLIPKYLGDYAFIQGLLLPECEINRIVKIPMLQFMNQRVDFYLSQANLVIEIDGAQHQGQLSQDKARDDYLYSNGIHVIRIPVSDLTEPLVNGHFEKIRTYLEKSSMLRAYLKQLKAVDPKEYAQKLRLTAVMRFQVLILESLRKGLLFLEDQSILCIRRHELSDDFASLALEDLWVWLEHLWLLRFGESFKRPEWRIQYVEDFGQRDSRCLYIDFSLERRYTDEDMIEPDILFVRTDYFDSEEENYFEMCIAEPIKYRVSRDLRKVLEFFLQNIFDKRNFRDGQFEIIQKALQREDVIGLLPTGAGKSICFQLPCLLQPCISLIVYPIKSLMKDQQQNLKAVSITQVGCVNSDISAEEKERVLKRFERGKQFFLMVTPERFLNKEFRQKLLTITRHYFIGYAVIDEVHCMSEWGHDFRISYLSLMKTIAAFSQEFSNKEHRICRMGLTATASSRILTDLRVEFSEGTEKFPKENIISLSDFTRPELEFHLIHDKDYKYTALVELLKKYRKEDGFLDQNDRAGVVFTPYVNAEIGCYELSLALSQELKTEVGWYAGSKPKKFLEGEKDFQTMREETQDRFKQNKLSLLVATKAFGMGIDKPNIYYTVHYGLPASVEAFYQEAGRAGRWDKHDESYADHKGQCTVLYTPESLSTTVLDRFFNKDAEVNEVKGALGWGGKDLRRQLFLLTNNQKDVEEDFQDCFKFYVHFYQANTVRYISVKECSSCYSRNEAAGMEVAEKAIYRLFLCGIIKSWTVDYLKGFEVSFLDDRRDSVFQSLEGYLNKYENIPHLNAKILEIKKATYVEKIIYFLIQWSYENIFYRRKQALKTMLDWCQEDLDDQAIKEKFNLYFEAIGEKDPLKLLKDNFLHTQDWVKIIESVKEDAKQTQQLKDRLSPYLEEYRNHRAYNFISGMIRLLSDEFADADGHERLKNVFAVLVEENNIQIARDLLEKGMLLVQDKPEEFRVLLCDTYLECFDVDRAYVAEKYQLPCVLSEQYRVGAELLSKINRRLYEQLREI